jgi:hypothetical protein
LAELRKIDGQRACDTRSDARHGLHEIEQFRSLGVGDEQAVDLFVELLDESREGSQNGRESCA